MQDGSLAPALGVELVGILVKWMAALFFLVVFLLLRRPDGHRRALTVWALVWAGVVICDSALIAGLFTLLGNPLPGEPRLTMFLAGLHWPGTLLSLSTILAGTWLVAGRTISRRVLVGVVLGALLTGGLIKLFGWQDVAERIMLVATPLILFSCVQLVFARAIGPRQRGMLFLGIALGAYALLSTLYLFSKSASLSSGFLGTLAEAVGLSAGFGDALVITALGAAVIVLLVQDSFLDASTQREVRLRDLAASEGRLTRIIGAAGEAIITFDADGRIDLANAAAEELFRLPRGGALGVLLTDLLDAPPLGPDGYAVSRENTTAATGRRPDGTTFPCEFTIGPLAAGERHGSVAILRDLTQRQQAQAEREVFERRMAESEKMFAIGRVVSGVAHELNNPLAVVLGQSEQLVEDARDAGVRNGLQLINEQAHRARHIVKDLLAFVRPREERRESVDLAHLAQRVVASQANQVAAHRVALLTDLPPRVAPVLADRVGIEQVVVNLLDNAMDAAGAGGVVRLSVREAAGEVELVVEDSGAGIAEELLDRIFEPFFTTKPTGEGTGLGLSVSLGVVQQHGGTLRVVNRPKPGVGARFTFALPVLVDVNAWTPPSPARAVVLPPPIRRDDGTLAEVLLIDDEPAVRATLARIFQRGGWPVRETSSGEEALAWLVDVPEIQSPAIILCDLKMPGMSGREVHAHLVELRPDLVPRMIFVTGDVVEAVTAGFLAGAGREVVEKPFTVAEIAAAVERVMAPH